MEVQRGEPEGPDSIIETDPRTLERMIFDGGDAAEAERSGALRLAGDRALATRLLKLYAPARS
jgi:ubiquinone biosynthesis protein UbiJ